MHLHVECSEFEFRVASLKSITSFKGDQPVLESRTSRSIRARGLFFVREKSDDVPFPPELIQATGTASVDIVFNDADVGIDANKQLGTFTFLDEERTALELSLSYPSRYIDWIRDILDKLNKHEQVLHIYGCPEGNMPLGALSLTVDELSRVTDGNLDFINLSSGLKRLELRGQG